MSIYDTLNDRQREVVFTTEGPVLVLAGAGSGKTRALTHRIAYLIEERGVRPWNILAITFTNKAAGEMQERVEKLVSDGGDGVWVSTFHAMCVRMLRRFADRIGFTSSFTIYDTDDQKTLMRQLIKRMDLDPKLYRERTVLSEISAAKNELITADDYARRHAGDFRKMRIGDLYTEYQAQCQKNNAMDFDDLLVKTVELLRNEREAREYYQERFQYIHVDEYQDTNTAQFELVRLLAGKHKNLCVVGDDDQSIYKFRGANIYNILNFEREYPGACTIRMEQNYRSTQNILDVANRVIAHNKGRKGKTLWTSQEAGSKIRVRQYDTAYQEAEAIVRDIERAVADGEKRSECAVLYRTNAQSRVLEEKCVAANLPYRLIGGVNFYQRMEIKDVLAYLKTIDNGLDDLAVQRIINVPKRGIGLTTLNKVADFAANNGLSFYEACRHAEYVPGLGKAAGKITSFVGQIESFRAEAQEENLAGLIELVLEKTGYQNELEQEGTTEAQARLENIEELISKATEYERGCETEPSLSDFLEQVALVADLENAAGEEDRVLLMTLHSAKGLEFDRVYLAGMEEGLFPSYLSITAEEEEELEEERRLCYVGITRARRELMLTSAKTRVVNGETRYGRPSRFLEEMPAAKLDQVGAGINAYESWRKNRAEAGSEERSFFREREEKWTERELPARSFSRQSLVGESELTQSWQRKKTEQKQADEKMKTTYSLGSRLREAGKQETLAYQVGDLVSHVKFGVGKVLAIEEQKTDYQVTVDFEGYGVKKMYAAFARLQKRWETGE